MLDYLRQSLEPRFTKLKAVKPGDLWNVIEFVTVHHSSSFSFFLPSNKCSCIFVKSTDGTLNGKVALAAAVVERRKEIDDDIYDKKNIFFPYNKYNDTLNWLKTS